MFEIHLGVPEMEELWKSLQKRHQDGTATKEEEKAAGSDIKLIADWQARPPAFFVLNRNLRADRF
jgi:hypothetical protein